jgi:hypothetical protein
VPAARSTDQQRNRFPRALFHLQGLQRRATRPDVVRLAFQRYQYGLPTAGDAPFDKVPESIAMPLKNDS